MTRIDPSVALYFESDVEFDKDVTKQLLTKLLCLHNLGPSYNGDAWKCMGCGCPEEHFPCATRQIILNFVKLYDGIYGEERIDEGATLLDPQKRPEGGLFPTIRFNTKLADQMIPDPREATQ